MRRTEVIQPREPGHKIEVRTVLVGAKYQTTATFADHYVLDEAECADRFDAGFVHAKMEATWGSMKICDAVLARACRVLP